MKILIWLMLFHICLFPKMLWAQEIDVSRDSANYKLSWIRLGIGAGGAGPAASFDIYVSPVKSNRYYGLHCFTSSGFMDVAQAHTIAGTYGWHLNQKYGFAGATIGLGPVLGVRHGKVLRQGSYGPIYEGESFFTLGIPLQAELRFDPSRHLGAGFLVCANLNFKFPYFGIMMSLNLGDLKPH